MEQAVKLSQHTEPPTSASRALQDPTSTFMKIYRRSLCLLHAWVEDCYAVDFARNAELRGRLHDFVSKVVAAVGGTRGGGSPGAVL